MRYTAQEVATWARDSINTLKPEFKNDTALYDKLATLSGLSRTHISCFARDPEYSITVKRLDRLCLSISILTAKTLRDEAKAVAGIAERSGAQETARTLNESVARLDVLMKELRGQA